MGADDDPMRRAIEAAHAVRRQTSPNPWVGAVLVTADGRTFEGATEPPPGRHAEVVALDAAARAGADTTNATLYVTLEPCSHHGRTPPCTDAILNARITHVVVGTTDPDPNVSGTGIEALKSHSITVELRNDEAVHDQLETYLHHRRTGRPWVTLKLAATLDGRTAAPDGSSRWITGEEARRDAHQLRADHDAILVGAGTIRADDPELTVRDHPTDHPTDRQPQRVVLGHAPPTAKVHPALELQGPLTQILDDLGARGILSVLVEGGPTTAHAFHAQRLVDRYVIYLAPKLAGGDDAKPLFHGPASPTIDAFATLIPRGTKQLGPDLRVDLDPPPMAN